MLTNIKFKNYKSFSEGKIEIRPITLLVGANSVGKSSILQLLLMLQQTALSDKNYKSALKLHGGNVSMGEGINLLKRKEVSKKLTITIGFDNKDLQELFTTKLLTQYCQELLLYASFLDNIFKDENESESDKSLFTTIVNTLTGRNGPSKSYKRSELDLRFLLNENQIIIEKTPFYELIEKTATKLEKIRVKNMSEKLKENIFFMRSNFNFSNLSSKKEEYLLSYDVLEKLSQKILDDKFELSYEIFYKDKVLVISKISLLNSKNELFTFEFDEHHENRLLNLKSDFLLDENRKDSRKNIPIHDLKKLFESPRTIFSFLNNDYDKVRLMQEDKYSVFSFIMYQILSNAVISARSNFTENKINYVSPLRAHPKRYYFLDKARVNSSVDTLDGDALTEILKENGQLKEQVNSWLRKFNLEVDVSPLQDIIHKIVVSQNSLSLDITDVGFGISQILPVIIQGFLSTPQSITVIEQPEIHIHPKMQADLADLFIDIVQKKDKNSNVSINKFLIVETHSEYLLKRLRRRISEGIISPENVAIYLISQPNKDGGIIEKLEIKDKGFFEWPHDFYGGELTKDITEFIKNQ